MEHISESINKKFGSNIGQWMKTGEKCDTCKTEIYKQEGIYPKTFPKALAGKKYTNHKCYCSNKSLGDREGERRLRLKKEKAMRDYGTYSVMNDDLKHATFENYEPDPSHSTQEKALKFAQRFAAGIVEGNKDVKNLLLSGKYGIGKSHLAAATCKYITAHGKSAAFINIPNFDIKLKSTWNRKSDKTEEDVFNYIANVDLLVLDDLGIGNQQGRHNDITRQLIDSRQGKFTFFTTNFNHHELKTSMESDVFDRMKKNTFGMQITGESRRQFISENDFIF
jgi:DNA replication protein DnaC